MSRESPPHAHKRSTFLRTQVFSYITYTVHKSTQARAGHWHLVTMQQTLWISWALNSHTDPDNQSHNAGNKSSNKNHLN